jgi:hypothetical protein
MAAVNIAWPKKTREFHNHHIDSTLWNSFQERRTPMNRLQQLLTLIVGTVVLAALLGATPAVAAPRIYAGADCLPLSEPLASGQSLIRAGGSRLASAAQLPLACPVHRDLDLSTNGFKAAVLVKGTGIKCRIESLDEDGVETIQNDFAESIESPGFQELLMEVTQSVPQGPYVLGCTLNPNTEIRKYTITENP